MSAPSRLTAVDLFAGAGGATQGLKQAGVAVLAAVEIDRDAAASYRLNHPEVRMERKDIRRVAPKALRSELGLRRGELTILTACPPCQGWSTLGTCDPSDPRNDLVRQVRRFVRAFLPEAVVLENVLGLKHDSRLHALICALKRWGYEVRRYRVNATAFGVPQTRQRLIVLAVRHTARHLPVSLRNPRPSGMAPGLSTVREVVKLTARLRREDDPLHWHRDLRPDSKRRVRAVPRGGGRFDLPPRLRLPCHDSLPVITATSSYGRLILREPAPTMTTRCTTVACGRFTHPTANRGITLREAALFQSFPIDYEFSGSYGSIEVQIGNAVPVRLAEGLARIVLAVLGRVRRQRVAS